MEKEKGPKVSVVIRLSRFEESCEQAIKSCIRVHALIQEVVVVVGENIPSDTAPLYDEWVDDRDTLRKEYGIPVRVYQEFDLTTCLKGPSNLMMEMTPTLGLSNKDGAFEAQFKALIEKRMHPRHGYCKFSIQTETDFATQGFSPWYVLWCAVFLLDWWRQLFSWFTFHGREQGLLVTEVWKGVTENRIPPNRSPWISCCGYWNHSERFPWHKMSLECRQGPVPTLQGYRYVMAQMDRRRMHNEPLQGGRGWLLTTLFLYHVASFAYWAWFLQIMVPGSADIPQRLAPYVSGFASGVLESILNPLHPTRLLFMGLFAFLHYIILGNHFRWSNPLLYVVVPAAIPFVIPVVQPWFIVWSYLDRTKKQFDKTLEPIVRNNNKKTE